MPAKYNIVFRKEELLDSDSNFYRLNGILQRRILELFNIHECPDEMLLEYTPSEPTGSSDGKFTPFKLVVLKCVGDEDWRVRLILKAAATEL